MKFILPLLASFICAQAIAQQLIVPDSYPTIQSAIDAAQAGDTVLVKPGEYFENIDYKGKGIVVGSEFVNTNYRTAIEQTIINGQNTKFVVTFNSGEDTTSKLIGFTLRNYGGDSVLQKGGYIIANNASPVIRSNFFEETGNNFIFYDFGGIFFINSHGVIEGNEFENISFHSAEYGAYIAAFDGAPKILNNKISGGYIGFVQRSAAIMVDNSDAEITGNEIYDFTGGYIHQAGAGIMAIDSDPVINFNTISNASFDNISGGILGINSNLEVTNNTIYYNAYGITLLDGGSAIVKNTIIWNSISAPFYNAEDKATITVTYSDIEEGWPGTGNIDAFPKFADPFDHYFHLSPNSPCIEAGDPASPLKPNGRRMDIGAWLTTALGTAVSNIEKGQELAVWPNPAVSNITISHSGSYIEVALYDLSGKLQKMQQANTATMEMNISHLPKGVYILNISTNETNTTEKLIIN